MDLLALLIRVLVGATLLVHAAQKSMGWFQGPGVSGMVPIFEGLGQVPARPMIVIAAVAEVVGGTLLILGLGTPVAALICATTMLVAGGAQCLASGIVWNARGGGEYPIFIAVTAIACAAGGGGRWSIDHALGAPWVSPGSGQSLVLFVGLVVVALIAAAPPLVRTRGILRSRSASS